MTASDTSPLTVADLQRILRATDSATLLVAPRLLRRIIKEACDLSGIALSIPHRKSLVIARERLLQIVDREELELPADRALPPTLILLSRPDPEKLAVLPRGNALLKYWRRLFHAHVHLAFERRLAEGHLTEAAIREHIHRIGQTEFDEIRAVLRQENYLLAPHDPAQIYSEFAALYLELRWFARHLLPRYFPALDDWERLDAILTEDVDAARLFAQTRVPGALEPRLPEPLPEEDTRSPEAEDHPPQPVRRSGKQYRLFMRKADQAARVGNSVRALLMRTRAGHIAPADRLETARAAVRADLEHLSHRLHAALGSETAAVERWRRALAPLLERAARGLWPVEARLLYDLQKVCIDHERPVYEIDLLEWAVSLGHRPMRRPLPCQPEVLRVKHLRSATRRLAVVRLSDRARQRLSGLLGVAVQQSEERLREQFRPRLTEALGQAAMQPRNLPERVALSKLREELLDRILEHGFLTMGDLRDAVSRNRLKLPDVAGPVEFLRGDRLLQTNGQLARTLDGVYHRGEVYLCGLERLSALAFGTRPGRFLTRYLILPFGGAFAALEGVEHLLRLIVRPLGIETEPHLASTSAITVLGLFLLALINSSAFRKQVVHAWAMALLAAGVALVDMPRFLLRLRPVRLILESRPFRFFHMYLLRPLLFSGLATMGFVLAGCAGRVTAQGSAAFFLAGFLLFNSRWGRTAEDVVADWLLRRWRSLHVDIFPALFRFVMDGFKRLLEGVDRLLYAVDEWLRFRSGESRWTLVTKLVLSSVWFFVTYLIRFYVNVFIEPQVNPIKHFPAVTVGAKLIFPFSMMIAPKVAEYLMPLGAQAAHAIAWVHVLLLPGMFGFLVWELRANWRLYQANESLVLQPVLVGHHGETLLQLLKPGFHSGTLPKIYSRLRRAERRGDSRAARKQRRALDQVQESLRHFVEREFLTLLGQSASWGGPPPTLAEIRTGSNRIRVALHGPGRSEAALWLTLEEQSGWLLASIAQPGWLPQLRPEQARAWRVALAGFYKLAGVDLVREQIEASLGPAVPSYDIADEGLVIWPVKDYKIEIIYDLRNATVLQPRARGGLPPAHMPALPVVPLVFGQVPVTWREWVEAWESDEAGKGLPEQFLDGVCLLPSRGMKDEG